MTHMFCISAQQNLLKEDESENKKVVDDMMGELEALFSVKDKPKPQTSTRYVT